MSCNTKLIHIQIIFMHTLLCFDFWTPTLQPLCALIVIGPEVKTEDRCMPTFIAPITHISTFMQIISSL